MGRVTSVLAVLACALAVASVPAEGAAKHYKNCGAVHKRYPHGIAKSRAAANRQVWVTGRPKISASLYKANKRLDRDHDGIACEAP
jgi:hypothetical protein